MKIKSIYIDGLHNAVCKTYNFGEVNYIYGNNGIGKSTILQAIQFALLGYIPGTAKNSKEALLRHSPKGHIDVQLCITDTGFGSDITIHRQITSKITSVDTVPGNIYISDIIKDIELPIFNFNEFVGQTANKLKEYFIKNILPTANGNLDWKQILTDAVADFNFSDRDAIVTYGLSLLDNSNKDALEQVIDANAAFKNEQSFKKTELQRLQNTIDSLIFYDDCTGVGNIDDIVSQILKINSLRDQLIRYNAAVNATKSVDTELISLRQRIEDFGGRQVYDELTGKLSELNTQMSELSAKLGDNQKAQDNLKHKISDNNQVIYGQGVCPYTKGTCQTIADQLDHLKADNEKYEAEKDALVAEYSKLAQNLHTLTSKQQEYDKKIRDFQNIWSRIKSLEATLTELPDKPATDKDVFTLDQEIAALTQTKEKLQANIKYNETIENITNLKYEAELQLAALTKWVKATDTNGLQTTLMLEPFEALANKMTGYIRKMYNNDSLKAHFNISSKANSFSFGLLRNEVYIPYDLLSSGEKCLYTLALMICITDTNKSPLKLLLCDDMFDHLDANAIESTFTTLKNVSGVQFIFAGVKECNAAKDILITV